MSAADQFDHIAARAWADSDAAVRKYHAQLAAITERRRITDENAGHRRGVTRETLAGHRGILLPAENIDLSPHTPMPTAMSPEPDDFGEQAPEPSVDSPDPDPDFSFSTGWLSDR